MLTTTSLEQARGLSAGRLAGVGGGKGGGGGGLPKAPPARPASAADKHNEIHNGSAVKKVEESGDEAYASTPFRWEEIELIRSYVPGFDVYASRRHAASNVDLMLWALLADAPDLALVLWRTCESPTCASLIGQSVCDKLADRHNVRKARLAALRDELSAGAIGILDHLESRESARKLLESNDGPYAVLGSYSKAPLSKLQLALDLGNLSFVAHRHCQGILDERWLGRSKLCGGVRLTRFEPITRLWLQSFANLLFVQVVRLRVNDLCETYPPPTSAGHSKQKAAWARVTRLQALVDFYTIPLVKRANMVLASLAYILLFCCMFFSRLCEAVGPWFVLLGAWTLSP